MKLAVVGMGGVGGFFGGKLAHAFQDKPDRSVSIYFVARGRHLEMIKRQGLLLKSSDSEVLNCRPELATDRLDDLPGTARMDDHTRILDMRAQINAGRQDHSVPDMALHSFFDVNAI